MADTTNKVTGGCLCGAVRFDVIGEPLSVVHCHCLSCRRQSGAAVVTLVGYTPNQVQFTGEARKIFESSPGVGRAFCGTCGSPLTWEGKSDGIGPLVELHISTFDNPDPFVPTSHVHHDERIAWFDAADDLPRFHTSDVGHEAYCHGPNIKSQMSKV